VSAFLATSNGAAQVAMLQLAQQAKRARLREREAELDERERAVRAAERLEIAHLQGCSSPARPISP